VPDEQFDETVEDINTLYRQAPELAQQSERVLSTDEMTGVQALERNHPKLLMAPGKVERQEFEYTRHGTQFCCSPATIKRDVAVLREKGLSIPTRGQVKDIGKRVSHKIQIVEDCYQEHLPPKHAIWLAVRRECKPQHKNLDIRDLVPVRLALVTDSELALLNDAKLKKQRAAYSTFQQHRLVRWCREAFEQGGVLTHLDLSLITGISETVICRLLLAYEQATGETVPTRGTVHDMGCSLTHKAEVVRRYLRGESPADIARALDHSQQSVDTYLRDYQKVRILAQKFSVAEIPPLAGLSRLLVNEYLELLQQYESGLPLYQEPEHTPNAANPSVGH
jgi:hypothetical protein